MVEFRTREAVLHKERAQWNQVMFIGAHTDDDALFRLTNTLAKHEIGVTIATLTNSDARNLSHYEPEQLTEVRWEEALRSGKIGGVAQVRRLEAPDGRLEYYKNEGVHFAGNLVDELSPMAIVTPSSEDMHRDHRNAAAIGTAVAGSRTPLYQTDTITGLGADGYQLQPDLYIPLTEEIAAIEKQTYLENTSQVTQLPPHEMEDVNNVLSMTERRGREIGVVHAAVLFETRNTSTNPLAEILVYSRAA